MALGKNTILSKDFILVATGQIISIFGNQILRYALPLYMLNQKGSSALFGTILAISFIPMLLLFPIRGIIADRMNKRNIMVMLDFITAILILLFYLLIGKVEIVPLIAVTMIILSGIQGAYQPAVNASIPVLVAPEHIMKANSVINLINSAASMAGPVIGGILFSIVGLIPILYVSIGCFFASAVMEIFINIPFEKRKTKGNIFTTGTNDLKESFRFMFKEQPVLWKASLIFAALGLFLTALIIIAVPVIITQHLGFAPDTANRLYGYAQGIIAVGAILGGLLAGLLSKKLKLKSGSLILIGSAFSVLIGGIALHFLSESIPVYVILAIGCGLYVTLSTLLQIQIMTFIQIITPKDLIGKVISCFMCVCMCSIPIGQFIYGIIFEKIESYLYLPFYIAVMIITGISVFTRHIFCQIDNLIEGKGERKR
ncbi:MFS transporter [Prevotella sp. 10(H)]|uniref:MFS transporter n=1 Tax=Prevotella sp. 10(H) TaxID=1158294 RepID=UPI0004A7063C|nr:MFS transporter [Prevotella sp. 10(H)]